MGTIGDTGEGSACTHGRLAWCCQAARTTLGFCEETFISNTEIAAAMG